MNITLLGLLLLSLVSVHSTESQSSEYLCADNYAEIKCPNDYKIVIEKIVNKFKSDSCVEFNGNLRHNTFKNCIGIVRDEQNARLACNGEQVCHLKIKRYNFKTDSSEANCNFTSNYAKVYYSCVPSIFFDFKFFFCLNS